MKVLVLGSEGIVGTGLCNHLERTCHSVIRWDIRLSVEHDISNSVNTRKLKML